MYVDIDTKKDEDALYFFPLFVIRRYIFIMLPSVAPESLQIPILLLLSSFYVIWYGKVHPHNQPKLFRLELVNETLNFIVLYHLMLFTNILKTWKIAEMMTFSIGKSMVYTILLIFLVNLVFAVCQMLLQSASERRKAAN
jgi:hypothetical protein